MMTALSTMLPTKPYVTTLRNLSFERPISLKKSGALKCAMYAVPSIESSTKTFADLRPASPRAPKTGACALGTVLASAPPAPYVPRRERATMNAAVYTTPAVPRIEVAESAASDLSEQSGRSTVEVSDEIQNRRLREGAGEYRERERAATPRAIPSRGGLCARVSRARAAASAHPAGAPWRRTSA